MRRISSLFPALVILALATAAPVLAETCATAPEIDPPLRSALESTARRFFEMAARNDVASLRQNSIPAVASDFSGIESAVSGHQEGLAGAQAKLRVLYLLDAQGNAPLQRAEFFCGIFTGRGHSADSAAFNIPNLPPGRFAVVIQDIAGGKEGPYTLTLILQEMGAAWKLAGFYAEPQTLAGHDFNWFLTRAREYKSRGQNHNAWFYYLTAWQLASPVDFMSTQELDKLWDEAQQARPSDVPVDKPVQFAAAGKTFNITEISPVPIGDKLYLRVRYQASENAGTSENPQLMKALLERYPEYREAFYALMASAVTPSGRDYPSVLAMKDAK
jgi:hypothetical protein